MIRLLAIFTSIVLFASPCLAAGTTDTTIQPPNYEWLLKKGLVEQIDSRYVVDPYAWEQHELRRDRSKKVAFFSIGTAIVLASVGGVVYKIGKDRDCRWCGSAEIATGVILIGGGGAALFTAAVLGAIASEENRIILLNKKLYEPYTISPKISRNGGGLEVAWRL